MSTRTALFPVVSLALVVAAFVLIGYGLSLDDPLPPRAFSPVVFDREVTRVVTATPTETAVPTLTMWEWERTATARASPAALFRPEWQTQARSELG